MQINKFQYAPGPDAAGGTGNAGSKKPVQTKIIPQADQDFQDVSQAVSASWIINPAITLLWKSNTDFAEEVQTFANSLQSRIVTGSLRPGQTYTIIQLDEKIDAAVTEVKIYIEKKYKSDGAQAQFARFGIIKENRKFTISRDRNNRKAALQQMINTIAAEGMGNEEFGTAFWTSIKTAYDAAAASASNTTGDVSGKVATKNEQKKAITKVMSALVLVLKGNYPDTYKEIYRQWGWKKESY